MLIILYTILFHKDGQVALEIPTNFKPKLRLILFLSLDKAHVFSLGGICNL